MTGISEILVLLLLIVCILILPRMFKGQPAKKASPLKKISPLSVKMRIAIFMSLLYPLSLALYMKPWKENLVSFISYGCFPILLFWGIVWVLSGKRQE
jgi:hypothetical protein